MFGDCLGSIKVPKVSVETDHKPLIYLHQAKVNNARLMRWALSLQPYRFRLMSIKGKENVGADYLSRM